MTKNKTTVSFTVDNEVYATFRQLCDALHLNASAYINDALRNFNNIESAILEKRRARLNK